MDIQEIMAFVIVLGAVVYAGLRFFRQFTHGDSAGSKCGKCELNKTVMKPPKK